ncbi:MAG: DUF2203 domain-containing protein [Planctomycetota bacterium]|jgi:hypothetical protein|nr:DUF2203 domain-containing protein [Planctomycetota bacterium]MDP6505535.1 DUF2203 domain-containing protein [Planctomycetota bacterium]
MKPKVFTLERAKAALPLVSRIVEDLKNAWIEIQEKKDEFTTRTQVETSLSEDVLKFREEIQELADKMNEYDQELSQLGIELKDPATGLIDFYCRHEERLVYLCWRHGEDDIDFWHELDAGFAGRQPIDCLHETE